VWASFPASCRTWGRRRFSCRWSAASPPNQVSALIMWPGDYRVSDFLRAGGIMTVLFIVVMLLMLNLPY